MRGLALLVLCTVLLCCLHADTAPPGIAFAFNDDIVPLSDKTHPDYAAALSRFQNAMLNAHNAKRAECGANPLTLISSLNTASQAYAEQLLQQGIFRHDSNRGPVGENLAMNTASRWADAQPLADLYLQFFNLILTEDPQNTWAVSMWNEEQNNYDQNTGLQIDPSGMPVGHFTQNVWKSTTMLGCGIAAKTNPV